MKDFVVTISREYGSGGHDIGKRLAGLLQVPFYDREIVELTAQKHAVDAERLHDMEERSMLPQVLGGLQRPGVGFESDDRLFILQAETILQLAQSSCVIVGRCADFVLRSHPGRYSFFLYSGMKQRLDRMRRESLIYRAQDPARAALRMDRRRAAYYKYHTGQEWGAPANYHLCVDSGVLGPQTAELLADFIRLGEQTGYREA